MPNPEALQQLRRVVEAAPPEQFNMNVYHTSCGTAHCAVGWAEIDGYFVERGFAIDKFPETFFGINHDDYVRLIGIDYVALIDVTKEAVISNIDRLLQGLPAESYAS